jgi:antitoxin (DNA-binding transcriptional repressor) of toxin-antitoxin stability system
MTGQLDVLVDLLGLSAPGEEALLVAPEPVPGRQASGPAAPSSPRTTSPLQDDELRVLRDQRTVAEELSDEPVEPVAFEEPPLEPLDPTVAARPSVPYEPPIPANQLRAALTMLVRRARVSDKVDVEAAIALFAEQRPFVELPRHVEQSTSRGATVVADVGPGMLPYLGDVARLVAEIGQIVGEPQLTVQWVEEIASGDNHVLLAEPGRPVVVVSTFGAARPPTELPGTRERWFAFADTAWEAEADVVALVPYRGRHWPRRLDRAMRFVAWDDLADVGRGHGRG